MHLTLRVNDICNLDCEYCFWKFTKNFELNDILLSISKMYEFLKYKNICKFHLYFHGGEPTIHKDILEILVFIRNKESEYNIKTTIEIQTNLVINKKLLNNITDIIDFWSVSVHYKELLKIKYCDNFISNLNCIPLHKLYNFDIMLENFESPIEHSEFFKYILLLKPFINNSKNSEMIYGYYNYELNKESLKKNKLFYNMHNKSQANYKIGNTIKTTNELFYEKLDFRDYKCDAGINDLILNGDGSLFFCGSHLTGIHGPKEPLCNIIKSDIKVINDLTSDGVICKWKECCGDFYIKRTKI